MAMAMSMVATCFSSPSPSPSPSPCSSSSTIALTLKELRRIRVVVDMANGGTVQDIPSPIPVSQFLLHHRNFLLCDSASIRVGKRPCPLRPSVHLAPGHLYLLLPLAAFQKRIMPSSCSFSASLLLLLLLLQQQEHKNMPPPTRGDAIWTRMRKRNRIAPSPAAVFPDLTMEAHTTTTAYSNIVCDSGPEVVTRYIEQLILRSNSWQPDLEAIEEEVASCTSHMLADVSSHVHLHKNAIKEESEEEKEEEEEEPKEEEVGESDDGIVPPAAAAGVPSLIKASSRWSVERRDRVMSAIVF